MIRDPSDGTVKPAIKPAISAGTSGLQTDKLKADEFKRLEASRDWLRGYFNARGNHEANETTPALRSEQAGT